MLSSNSETCQWEIRVFLDEVASLKLNPLREGSLRKGRRVGAGTFSIVSEAFYSSKPCTEPRVVALKELRSGKHDFDKLSKQLISEASVLARLDHRNIIQYIGCGVSLKPSIPSMFMVQEFLSGGSLHEYISRLRRRRVSHNPRYSYSLATALRWATQVSSAVAYLHSEDIGIIHRDIKLANLLLTDRSVEYADVKLGDFGLSTDSKNMKPVSQTTVEIAPWKIQALSHQTRKNLSRVVIPTQTQTIANCCMTWKKKSESFDDTFTASPVNEAYYDLTEETGSYMYMCPEVWLGLPYNYKADIYSLGVLIAELLTGRPLSSCLLPERSYEEAKNFAYAVANGLRLKCPKHFPKPIAALLESCWDRDPEQRPTASQIHDVLKAYAKTLKDAHKSPLFHSMGLSYIQKLKLSIARARYPPRE